MVEWHSQIYAFTCVQSVHFRFTETELLVFEVLVDLDGTGLFLLETGLRQRSKTHRVRGGGRRMETLEHCGRIGTLGMVREEVAVGKERGVGLDRVVVGFDRGLRGRVSG